MRPVIQPLALAIFGLLPGLAGANRIDALLERRFADDWTGACVIAAVIDGQRVEKGQYCADPARRARLGDAFEVGSVSKTMNAALLAALVAEGKLELDMPLRHYLPDGAVVPERDGVAITLRQLATHTAGLPPLPPGFAPRNPADPYADLAPGALIDALAKTELASTPGTAWAYSNFGAMLLSLVVAEASGGDYEAALRQRLFAPLGMVQSGASRLPDGVEDVSGHRPTGVVVPGWRFHPALSGVGAVRASIDDMVRYVQGQFADTPASEALKATHLPQTEIGRPMALGWLRSPLGGRELLAHEGGTGGFSSFVAFDVERHRGVVVLADTALANVGGLGDVGLPLFDERVPPGEPRRKIPAPAATLAALSGEFRLQNGMAMTLGEEGGRLTVQVPGQSRFVFEHDSRGDFFPTDFDALLKPRPDGRGFVFLQGGGALAATRIAAPDGTAPVTGAIAVPAPLSDYVGRYPLLPGFDLRIFEEGERLMAQATGQGAFALDAAGTDRFSAVAFDIVIRFERDAAGHVRSLTLAQDGAEMRGERR